MIPCIVCELTVRLRQQALLWDGCQRWQHRTCNTGIGQDDYREVAEQRLFKVGMENLFRALSRTFYDNCRNSRALIG